MAHVHLPHGAGIVDLADDQLRSFFSLVDKDYDQEHGGETGVEHSSPLPFTFPQAEDFYSMSVNEAVGENIYCEHGQLGARERALGLPRDVFISHRSPTWRFIGPTITKDYCTSPQAWKQIWFIHHEGRLLAALGTWVV